MFAIPSSEEKLSSRKGEWNARGHQKWMKLEIHFSVDRGIHKTTPENDCKDMQDLLGSAR